ncbi:MAG: hypothetical protein NTY77_04095 [Elusimicrobia bacterium]|nr:hypothetical protein [Elusimicrobiota bacterium]
MLFPELVLDVFILLLFVKTAGVCASAAVVLRLCGPGKAGVFWRRYWAWEYAGENVFDASVWLATVLGFLYSRRLLGGLGGNGLAAALGEHPALVLGIGAALAWFAVSTVLQTLSCLRRTQVLCEKINHLPLLKKLGQWVLQLSLLYLELTGWSQALKAGQAGLELVLKRALEGRINRMLYRSLLLLAVECAARVAAVAAAGYVATGRLRLW